MLKTTERAKMSLSKEQLLREAISKLNGSGAHACYCARSVDGGCTCALKDEYVDELISLITKHTAQYRKMLERIGIDKCEECKDFCLDWDMTWCETCQKAMHQGTCTGYEYTDPEDGYSVCKQCIKDGEAQKQQLNTANE